MTAFVGECHTDWAGASQYHNTLLFLPGLVANGRSQVDLIPRVQDAPVRAEEDPQTGFLEDLDVVVVGVAHGPAGAVPPGLLAVRPVHEPDVAVHPVVELIIAGHLDHIVRKNR